MTIIGIDPGVTTGLACWRGDKGEPGKWTIEQMGPEEHHLNLRNYLKKNAVRTYDTCEVHIVCESFEFRNTSRTGTELASVEYIGIVKLHRDLYNVPVYFQTASMGKVRPNAFVSPQTLRALGLWSGVVNKHAHDAMGHMLYWMINKGDINRLDLLKKGWS